MLEDVLARIEDRRQTATRSLSGCADRTPVADARA